MNKKPKKGTRIKTGAAALEGFRIVARKALFVLPLAVSAAILISTMYFFVDKLGIPKEGVAGASGSLADLSETMIAVMLIAVILVVWLRRVLLGPAGEGPHLSMRTLHMLMAVFAIGLALVLVKVAAIAAGLLLARNDMNILILGADAVAWVVAAWVIGRFFFALPPISLGRRMAFGKAWKMSGDQSPRLMLVVVLIGVPFEILTGLLARLQETLLLGDSPTILVAVVVVKNFVLVLHIFVGSAALSICYAALGGVGPIVEARRNLPREPETATA